MKTCKTCKYWTGECHDERSFRACEHPKVPASEHQMHPPPSDGFGSFDGEPYSGGGTFATGPDFGCIHHEEKA